MQLAPYHGPMEANEAIETEGAIEMRQPVLALPPGLEAELAEDVAEAAFDVVALYLDDAGGACYSKVHLLPVHWRLVYVLYDLDAEVCNGGFHQFFTNKGGAFDDHLAEDFAALKHGEFSELLLGVFSKYCGIDYTEQWENRGKSWDKFAEGYREGTFGSEEESYYAIEPGLVEVMGEYVREHFDDYTSEEGRNPFELGPVLEELEEEGDEPEYSFWTRLQWNPIVAALPTYYLWRTSYLDGFPIGRTVVACVSALWLSETLFLFFAPTLIKWLRDEDDDE